MIELLDQYLRTISKNIVMKNILVIDDDLMTREHLRDLLNEGGYKAITATNTFDAHKLVLENNIDLIISDLMMPYFSVDGFLDWIKDEYCNKIPFILISGLEYSEIKKRAALAETDFFIEKPIDPLTLFRYIKCLELKKKRNV